MNVLLQKYLPAAIRRIVIPPQTTDTPGECVTYKETNTVHTRI